MDISIEIKMYVVGFTLLIIAFILIYMAFEDRKLARELGKLPDREGLQEQPDQNSC